jgi:hypothetical protein
VREVVDVARGPSLFVRALSMDEGRKLQKITRTSKDPIRMHRAIVVIMSDQSQAVRDITSLLQVGEEYVRDVIHAFNERGFDALDPRQPPSTSPALVESATPGFAALSGGGKPDDDHSGRSIGYLEQQAAARPDPSRRPLKPLVGDHADRTQEVSPGDSPGIGSCLDLVQ